MTTQQLQWLDEVDAYSQLAKKAVEGREDIATPNRFFTVADARMVLSAAKQIRNAARRTMSVRNGRMLIHFGTEA